MLRSFRHLTLGTKRMTSPHRLPGGERRGKRKHSTIFLESKTNAANQTNIGTVPKATFGETSERRGGAHVGFTERTLN